MATHNVTRSRHLPGIGLDELREGGRSDAERRDRRERDRDDREQRDGAFQEQIGERKAIVLVEDGERQGQRRVMPDELHRPRCLPAMQLAQVKSGDGEDRQRRRPQRAPGARAPAGHRRQRDRERDERVGQQSHAEWRRDRGLRPCGGDVQHGGQTADRVGDQPRVSASTAPRTV